MANDSDQAIRVEQKREYERRIQLRKEKTPVAEKGSPDSDVRELSPEYIYTTPGRVEDFGNVSFEPVDKPRNNLAPPSPFKPTKPRKPKGRTAFCKENPEYPKCIQDEKVFCLENPSDPRCNDEVDVYKDLGFFREEVRNIFDPVKRSRTNQSKKPVATMYESKQDDVQFTPQKVVRTECRCKDGTVALGYLDTTTGQKDCSPCNRKTFTNPTIYKNYKTKRRTPNFNGKKVPLRKQVGVSHFGDVEMKGCQTGNAEKTLERVNAVSTLNNVINVDTVDSRGGAKITAPQNTQALPITLYDDATMNVYGI